MVDNDWGSAGLTLGCFVGGACSSVGPGGASGAFGCAGETSLETARLRTKRSRRLRSALQRRRSEGNVHLVIRGRVG